MKSAEHGGGPPAPAQNPPVSEYTPPDITGPASGCPIVPDSEYTPPADVPPPLVIVTSNEERELPAPFLRRCLVLTLKLPKLHRELTDYLVERGALHFPAMYRDYPDALTKAAAALIAYRNKAAEEGVYAPGLAEYLDLLRVLDRIGGDPAGPLGEFHALFFEKQQPA